MFFDKKVSSTMRERKRLGFTLELKSLDSQGRFAGYASVFNVVDNQRDIILPGAFVSSVKGRVQEIKFLWQHQQDEPIGVLDAVFEDAYGLYVEGRLLLTVQRAKEAYTLLKAGAISGLSIGYNGSKRYVQALATPTGSTASGMPIGVVALRGKPAYVPVVLP